MARRTRSILIDATLNRIFTQTDSTTNANAANLIAGVKMFTKALVSPSAQAATYAKNLGNGVVLAGNGGTVANVVLRAYKAPQGGAGIVASIRKGTTYAASTQVTTVTLPSGQLSATLTPSLSFDAGERIFVDLLQGGTIITGAGFSITFNYYAL